MSQVASVERIIYTYHLNPCSVHLQIIIAYVSIATLSGCSFHHLSFIIFIRVEPVDPHSGQYMFTLSVKAGGLERTLCDPVVMKLFTGPHQLDFAALCVAIVGKGRLAIILTKNPVSFPRKLVFRLTVYFACGSGFALVTQTTVSSRKMSFGLAKTRTSGLSEMLILPSSQVAHISCFSIKDSLEKPWSNLSLGLLRQYHDEKSGLLKRAPRWNVTDGNLYKITLEYEAGGVGRILLDDCHIRLDEGCDPQTIAFVL